MKNKSESHKENGNPIAKEYKSKWRAKCLAKFKVNSKTKCIAKYKAKHKAKCLSKCKAKSKEKSKEKCKAKYKVKCKAKCKAIWKAKQSKGKRKAKQNKNKSLIMYHMEQRVNEMTKYDLNFLIMHYNLKYKLFQIGYSGIYHQ